MSVITELLESIRGKRREKFATTAEQYDAAVTVLARGEQIDVDHMAELLDVLDKSDEDLEADVSAKQRRIAAAERLTHLQKVKASIPKLEATVKKLDEEITQFLSEKRPVLDAACARLRAAENEAGAIYGEETILRTIGIPVSVKQRLDALQPLITERREKYEHYEFRTENKKYLSQAQRRVEEAEEHLRKTPRDQPSNLRGAQSELDKAKNWLAQIEQAVARQQPLADEIAELDKQISAERAAIEQMLMQP